ncbi:MAG: aminotransferase class V-fold PLP-dependent enzyme [bacterium]
MALKREEFPVAEDYAYFQHCAVSALPRRTRERINQLTEEMMHSGCLKEGEWINAIKGVRNLAADILGVASDRVGFVTSTSHGLSWVAESLPLSEGDEVLIPDVEFPANRFPWQNLERKGVSFRTLATEDGAFYESDVREALREETSVLALSSVQFRNGFRCDLEAIGSLCHDRDVHFVVDGIQSIGWDNLDLHSLPVDAMAADAHKWLCGPEGVGLLYLDRTFQKELEPAMVGWQSVKDPWQFSEPDFDLKEDAAVVEMGSYNTIGLLAMGKSLELLKDAGIQSVWAHNLDLKEQLTEELRRRSFECSQTDWPRQNQSPIVSFNHPDLETSGLVESAEEYGIQMSVRSGRPRVALHLYNNRRDIDRLVEFLQREVSG